MIVHTGILPGISLTGACAAATYAAIMNTPTWNNGVSRLLSCHLPHIAYTTSRNTATTSDISIYKHTRQNMFSMKMRNNNSRATLEMISQVVRFAPGMERKHIIFLLLVMQRVKRHLFPLVSGTGTSYAGTTRQQD